MVNTTTNKNADQTVVSDKADCDSVTVQVAAGFLSKEAHAIEQQVSWLAGQLNGMTTPADYERVMPHIDDVFESLKQLAINSRRHHTEIRKEVSA